MVDGGFFLATRSGNGKGRNDPETMRQQKIQRQERAVIPGLCQLIALAIGVRFFDTFPYPIQIVLVIEAYCSYPRYYCLIDMQ